MKEGMKPNRIRQAENLSIFQGRWHGIYYENGVPNPGGERISKEQIMLQGVVYDLPKPSKGK